MVVAAGLLGALLTPLSGVAYDASIGWQPAAGAAGYTVYVRYGTTGAAQPTDVGMPSTNSDGLLRVVVASLPLGPTTYFSVAGYNASHTAGAVSQLLSITYAQAAAVSDSDGDDLTDAREDTDLDGVVDVRETDPRNPDSDGDGFSDGREVLVLGTDPLDSGSPPPPPPPTTTTTTLPAQCANANDCGDADACTIDSCVSGKCVHKAASTGSCDDGDPCTVGDACASGACVGWALNCTHLDGPCSRGVCDPQLAECKAVQVASGSGCNDGSGCTTGDVCRAGVCSGVDTCAATSFCDGATKTCKVRTEVWVSAASDETATFMGAMTSGTAYADGDDLDTAADSLEPSLVFATGSTNDLKATSGDKVSYVVDLPAAGQWYMWGRFYYPGRTGSNDANSFFVRIDTGAALKFGNKKGFFRQWHWDGDGRVETGAPLPLALGQLAAGPHTVTIAKREVAPIAPRLDMFVFTQDPGWVPTE